MCVSELMICNDLLTRNRMSGNELIATKANQIGDPIPIRSVKVDAVFELATVS